MSLFVFLSLGPGFFLHMKRERERGRESVSSASNLVALGPQYLAVSGTGFSISYNCGTFVVGKISSAITTYVCMNPMNVIMNQYAQDT